MADNDRFLSLEERRARSLRKLREAQPSLASKDDFGNFTGSNGYIKASNNFEDEQARQRSINANLSSRSDFGDMPGGFVAGGERKGSQSYEGPAVEDYSAASLRSKSDFGNMPGKLSSRSINSLRRVAQSGRQSEADRLMDIYNKQGGASDEDIASAYRSINPTMKKGGKVATKKVAKKPMKISKPKAVKYARGGGIESRGKTRGKFV